MRISLLKPRISLNSKLQIADEDFFGALRRTEYSRLDSTNHTYLDYTGGNLYPASLLKKHHALLAKNVFGNPHSGNPTSRYSTELINETREKVLRFFNADDYICVFTQNATGALKIVGESYPFNEKSSFVLLIDNHNSVNGIREFCNSKGGAAKYVPIQYKNLEIDEPALRKSIDETTKGENNLFAFPAQSNVSGLKHDLKWISYAQSKGFDVLLDAAAFVPTSKLDLSLVKPEFVSVSFYKIFGYPTGVGCLLIRKSAFHKLKKPWFAGGTVSFASAVNQTYFLTDSHERFEDGTVNYLDIPAVKFGLEYIGSIGLNRISKRVHSLIETLAAELNKIIHDNGQPVIKILGPKSFSNRGGTLIMNFLDINGEQYPNGEFEKRANDNLISIRSGCFCNPGIDEINNCVTKDEVTAYFTDRKEEDYDEFISYLKEIRGATRVSVGIATTEKDIIKFTSLVRSLQNKAVANSLLSKKKVSGY